MKRDLGHERHIRGLAVSFHLGALVFMGLSVFLLGTVPDMPPAENAKVVGMGLTGAVAVVVGPGLWRYHGWARWASLALAASAPFMSRGWLGRLLLVAFAGGAGWALLASASSRIFTPDYREGVASKHALVRFWASPLFYGPLAGVLLVPLLGVLAVLAR